MLCLLTARFLFPCVYLAPADLGEHTGLCCTGQAANFAMALMLVYGVVNH